MFAGRVNPWYYARQECLPEGLTLGIMLGTECSVRVVNPSYFDRQSLLLDLLVGLMFVRRVKH